VNRATVESFGILRYEAVHAAYERHCAYAVDHADLLFALLSLCWWRQRHS